MGVTRVACHTFLSYAFIRLSYWTLPYAMLGKLVELYDLIAQRNKGNSRLVAESNITLLVKHQHFFLSEFSRYTRSTGGSNFDRVLDCDHVRNEDTRDRYEVVPIMEKLQEKRL